MTRRDYSKTTGWVKWPTETAIQHDAEGLAVYLLVPEDDQTPESFVACIPYTTVMMAYPDAISGIVGAAFDDVWPRDPDDALDFPEDGSSINLLAALCIGGSGGVWTDKVTAEHWVCTYEDLTPEGKQLFESLRQLYGKEPIIVTFLDT